MIFIGNDIVKVSRIERLLKIYGDHFLNKIFSEDEIKIVKNKKQSSIHFSGKFSAKESSRKAIMTAGISNIYFKDIEVLNRSDGSPYIRVKSFKEFNRIKNLQISISHTSEYATAFTILEISQA